MSDEAGGEGKVVPYRARPKRACPTCGKPAVAKFRPFCSKRCANVDLNRWLSGHYRIPTEEAPGEGAVPPEEEEG
jgi:endogenous inhibitor of DNA gyrase (YacG/DUF329 family)